MIAQKCMRRLWFVEDGETTVLFRGKGAKAKARQYASAFTPMFAGSLFEQMPWDLDEGPPPRRDW